MGNSRKPQPKKAVFDPINVTKRDLINIEKIILKRVDPGDFYIGVNEKFSKGVPFPHWEYEFDTARHMNPWPEKVKVIEVKIKRPNLFVRFEKRKTTVHSARVYSRGGELRAVDRIFDDIVNYTIKGSLKIE